MLPEVKALARALSLHPTDHPILETITGVTQRNIGRVNVWAHSVDQTRTYLPRILDTGLDGTFWFVDPVKRKTSQRNLTPGSGHVNILAGRAMDRTFLTKGTVDGYGYYNSFGKLPDYTRCPVTLNLKENGTAIWSPEIQKALEKHPELAQAFYSSRFYISDTHLADIRFVKSHELNGIRLGLDQAALDQPVSVIKYHKIKREFSTKTVTLNEYLANPHTYICLAPLKKNVTLRSTSVRDQSYECEYIGYSLIISDYMFKERSLIDLVKLLQAVNTNQIPHLLEPGLQAKYMEAGGKLAKYWSGFSQVISGADPAEVLKLVKEVPEPTPEQIAIVTNKVLDVEKLEVVQAFHKINKEVLETEKVVNDTNIKLRDTEMQHSKANRDFLDTKKRIRVTEDELRNLKDRATTLTTSAQALEDNLIKAREVYYGVTSAHHLAINKRGDAVSQLVGFKSDLPDNAKEDYDLHISSIQWNNGAMLRLFPEKGIFTLIMGFGNDKERPLSELANVLVQMQTVNLQSVVLYNTKPVRITIDATDPTKAPHRQIVGGPYKVTLNIHRDSIVGHVHLASESAVFGIQPLDSTIFNLKQHPHSAPFKCDVGNIEKLAQFFAAPTKACFGEYERPLASAFTANNLNLIRRYTHLWLTNAFSGDRWGVEFSWFPTPNQVKLG